MARATDRGKWRTTRHKRVVMHPNGATTTTSRDDRNELRRATTLYRPTMITADAMPQQRSAGTLDRRLRLHCSNCTARRTGRRRSGLNRVVGHYLFGVIFAHAARIRSMSACNCPMRFRPSRSDASCRSIAAIASANCFFEPFKIGAGHGRGCRRLGHVSRSRGAIVIQSGQARLSGTRARQPVTASAHRPTPCTATAWNTE